MAKEPGTGPQRAWTASKLGPAVATPASFGDLTNEQILGGLVGLVAVQDRAIRELVAEVDRLRRRMARLNH